jgi:pyrroline-5-carboxylate reductase
MSKIAFIGSGRMASAMVDGLLAKAVYAPSDIACLGGNGQSAAALAARTGIRLGTNLEDLIASSEIVVVAFNLNISPVQILDLRSSPKTAS